MDGTNHGLKGLPNVAQYADDAVSALTDADPDRLIYVGGPWISKKMAGAIDVSRSSDAHIAIISAGSAIAKPNHSHECKSIGALH